jgi:uncharacterized membrane protein YhiD involved in acid resistance
MTQFSAESVESVTLSLVVAGLLGGVVAAIYRWTRRDDSLPSFATTLLLLCILICVVMTTLGTSDASAIARGIGLFGVFSILRFRTVLENPRDITFVFFALAVGMATGVGNLMVAIITTVVVSALILTIHYATSDGNKRNGNGSWTVDLTYRVPSEGTAPGYDATVKSHASAYEIVEQEIKKDGKTDVRLTVRMKPSHAPEDLIRDLVTLDGVESARFRIA